MWRYTCTFRADSISSVKYKYVIHSKGSEINFWGSRIPFFSKDPFSREERSIRRVTSEVQFDVFHFHDDRKYSYETLPQSVIFYVQWLFKSVVNSNSEFISQIEKLDFQCLKSNHAKSMVIWVIEQAVGDSLSHAQYWYLCIVLALIKENSEYLIIPSDCQTAKACDNLLECFKASSNTNLHSKPNLKVLKNVATLLVSKSNSPFWLTLAAYFYPYLGIKFLLDKEHATGLNHRYTDKGEYQKWVKGLFSNLKEVKTIEDHAAHQRLLHLVLKSAPFLEDALDVFHAPCVRGFFAKDDELGDFLVKFYRDRQQSSNETCEKLVKVFEILKMFRLNISKVMYPILLECTKSDDKLNDGHVEIFVECISENVLVIDQISGLLMELSKSKSILRQIVVLTILEDKRFEKNWHEMGLTKKVQICTSWVVTKVTNTILERRVNSSEKIELVFEEINAIMQCSLNSTNVPLVEEVFTSVLERILKNEEPIFFLQAFASLEKCIFAVQKCYKSHIRKILKQTPRVVKRSSKFLGEFSTSRYVRFYLFDIIIFYALRIWDYICAQHSQYN